MPKPRAKPAWEQQDTKAASARSAARPLGGGPSPSLPGHAFQVLTHRVLLLCPTGLPQMPAHLVPQQGHGQKLPSISRFPARAVSPLKTQIHRTPWKKPQQQAWLCPGTSRVPEHPARLKRPTRSFTWRTTTLKVRLKQTPSNQFLQLGLFLSSCVSLDHGLDEPSHAQRWDSGTSYPTLRPRIFGSLSLVLSLPWISSNSITSSQGSFAIRSVAILP